MLHFFNPKPLHTPQIWTYLKLSKLNSLTPGDAIETALRRMNLIVEAGVAEIIVGDATLRGVSLG